MNNHQQTTDYNRPTEWIDAKDKREKMNKVLRSFLRCGRMTTWVIALAIATSTFSSDWILQSAIADGKPILGLAVTGLESARVNVPHEMKVKLINPGAAAQDSRLRLYIQDEMDREVRLADIKIHIQEGKSWKEVQVEAIDGGVMGAVGAEGQVHKERHQRGGFAIRSKANKSWKIRVTFRLPGRYSVVAAVSPNNGETQLAQPASFSVEAL